jgi:hypothetical protein
VPNFKSILAAAAAASVLAASSLAVAQTAGPQTRSATMQPGDRMQLGPMMGERVVRQVMIGDDGATVVLMFDMAPGQPQSQRVLRLENKNGMLEVVYDTQVPTMSLGQGGIPRLVQGGGGMYSVEYDRR